MSFIGKCASQSIAWHASFRHITQHTFSLWMTLYIGAALNASVWCQTLRAISPPDATQLLAIFLTFICVLSFTLCLLHIAALFGNTIYRFFASFMLFFSAVAAYYMSMFNVVIGYGVMHAVFTTELDLSQESIGTDFSWWVMLTTALPLFVVWHIRLPRQAWHTFTHAKKWWHAVMELVCLLLLLWIAAQGLQKIDQHTPQAQQMANRAGVMAHRYLPSNWIAGLGMVIYHHVDQLWTPHPLFSPAEAFDYQADPQQDDLNIIFVIGESARSDHFGVLGYQRNTTPWLSQEKNSIALQGRSCDTSTYLSLRCMFVREGGNLNDAARTPSERNLFHTLSTLGFSVDLFSMQSEIWFYNSVNANNYLLREMISAAPGNEAKPVDDMLLVPLLAQSISNHPEGKHLVVLHTKGSHYQYSQRYPRDFAQFTPECIDIDDDCSNTQLINAYDNSILYTDYFLKKVIDQVRDRKAILFYSSDHGESIAEGRHFHATPKEIAPPEQRTIPIVIWMSDKMLATHTGSRAYQQLHAFKQEQRIARHEAIFDSVLGCIGYTSTQPNALPNLSWCQ